MSHKKFSKWWHMWKSIGDKSGEYARLRKKNPTSKHYFFSTFAAERCGREPSWGNIEPARFINEDCFSHSFWLLSAAGSCRSWHKFEMHRSLKVQPMKIKILFGCKSGFVYYFTASALFSHWVFRSLLSYRAHFSSTVIVVQKWLYTLTRIKGKIQALQLLLIGGETVEPMSNFFRIVHFRQVST